MKTRIGASLLTIAMLSFLAMSTAAQAQVGPDLTNATNPNAAQGEWIWGHLDDPVLQFGATSIAADKGTPSTIYVGGPNFIAVSDDSGSSWTETLRFGRTSDTDTDTESAEEDDSEQENKGLTNEQRVAVLREYLYKELEDELDTETAEGLLEEMTDEELIDADSIEDIEILKNLELKMESDLQHVIAEAEATNGLNLSDFDPYIDRYIILKNNGAEEDMAIRQAGICSSVWDIVPTAELTYAITSDAIYMTDNKGQTWQTFLAAPETTSILSFGVSESNQTFAIGMTNGMLFTRNAGADWVQLNDVIQGAVFRINIQSENNIWVLTTETIYHSTDNGLTWDETKPKLGGNELITDIIPGMAGALAVTNQGLYYTENGKKWVDVPCGPFADEIVRQVVPTDTMLSSFIVRTDSHVFQYSADGWKSLNDMLFANELGKLILMSDDYSLAAMATQSGVWLAQNLMQLAISDEYKNLLSTWSKEPTDYEIIQKALEAHYLDEDSMHKWGLRSRLAWLLPTVTFDYNHLQTNSNRGKIVATLLEHESAGYDETLTFIRQKQTYWQVMARWNIEIAKGFRDEQSGVQQEMTLKSRRNSLINNVKKLINKRRASQSTIFLDIPKIPENKKSTKKKYVKAALKLQESEASLHYLTGGYYIPAVHPEKSSEQ